MDRKNNIPHTYSCEKDLKSYSYDFNLEYDIKGNHHSYFHHHTHIYIYNEGITPDYIIGDVEMSDDGVVIEHQPTFYNIEDHERHIFYTHYHIHEYRHHFHIPK